MRVILDTNILFSALLSDQGAPHSVYLAWQERRFELLTCSFQIEELRRASRYPKFRDRLKPHLVGLMVNNLYGATLIGRLPAGHEAADSFDSWLLALADAGRADYLVTGDRRSGLLERGRIGTGRILTCAAFYEIIA